MEEKILVIDDAEDHHLLIQKIFTRSCRVISAYTLAEADKELLKSSFDLILLDVHMPDGEGFSYFAKLQSQEHTSEIPVIFVTGKDDTPAEAMGFSLGAEDYVVKPVDPMRLKARVEARLKIFRERKNRDSVINQGNIRLSVASQKVAIVAGGREHAIALTPVEFKLLYHMLRNEERVLTREQLLTAVWDDASEVFDRTVDMHMSKLRKKIALSDFAIKAVHGTGYRLTRKAASQPSAAECEEQD